LVYEPVEVALRRNDLGVMAALTRLPKCGQRVAGLRGQWFRFENIHRNHPSTGYEKSRPLPGLAQIGSFPQCRIK
jgi:hypothetical protein